MIFFMPQWTCDDLVRHAQNARDVRPYYFLVFFIAFGFEAFNVTLAGDDWPAVQSDRFQYDWVVSIGRWMNQVVWRLAGDNAFAPAVTISILALCFFAAAWVFTFVQGWLTRTALFLFAAILALFPVNAEIVPFQMAQLNYGVGMVSGTLGGAMAILHIEAWMVGRRRLGAACALAAVVLYCRRGGILSAGGVAFRIRGRLGALAAR